MEPVLCAQDHGGNAQQTSPIESAQLVLEVSRNHVADFTQGIEEMTVRRGDLRSNHAGGNLPGGGSTTAESQDAVQGTSQADHSSEFNMFGNGVRCCCLDAGAQHD